MSDLPGVPHLVHNTFPKDNRTYMVAALGPVAVDQPRQPLIELTLTPFLGNKVELDQRDVLHQSRIELHIADLMTIGTGEMIAAQRKERTPKKLLAARSVKLDMAAQQIKTFAELQGVFGRDGSYPLRATWEMVKHLKCLVFTVGNGTILIPCLDAWRFTFGSSSKMLFAITQSDFTDSLSEARQGSVLNTPDGQQHSSLDADEGSRWQGTLSLHVPTGYTNGDVSTWAWLVSDQLAADAATRFYPSLLAAQQANTRFSSPRFEFPFSGQPKFNLRGVQLPHGQFLVLQIVSTDAALPIPLDIVHDIPAPPESEQDGQEMQKSGPKPRLNGSEVNVDSLRPPDARLTTLHLGLGQNRFSAFERLRIRAKVRGKRRDVIGGHSGPVIEDELSSGDKELGGEGGRQLGIEEQPIVPPKPVDHIGKFCNLLGVCETLNAAGIKSAFLPIGREQEGDPTTPIPATAGAAATWVGKGVTARRALIAQLSKGEFVAYAVEWERINDGDYGKLLLVSAGQDEIADQVLLDLLGECAAKRGVWPTGALLTPKRWGLIHREPNPASMGARIAAKLDKTQWGTVSEPVAAPVKETSE